MKIAIARSLVFRPSLLLLDEPTSNLDIETIEKLKHLLISRKEETTIIFTSHNRDFIEAISDEALLLVNKRLEWGN